MLDNPPQKKRAKSKSLGKPKQERPASRRKSSVTPSLSDRRKQLLAVSARLFAEYGFETTSVRQIADAVQLLPGSLYHHFSTKEEILHEIIRGPLEQMVKDNERISRLPVDPEKQLIAGVILRFYTYVNEGQAHSILQNDGKFFRRREDFAYVEAAKSRSFHVQEAMLKEGMAAGLFHPNIDTYLMIGTFARMLTSAAAWFRSGDIHSSDKPEQYTFDRVLDFHLDCILRMIRAPARLDEPVAREECELLVLPAKPAG